MKTQLLIVIVFSIMSCSNPVHATKYYVANDGDDSNNGTSTFSPWKSIHKVNAQNFNPGDTIFFKAGDIWRMETLIPKSSGRRGEHIVFSSYGSGEKPKIFGSELINSYSRYELNEHVYVGAEDIPINPTNYDSRNYKGSIFYVFTDTIVWGDGILQYKESINQLTKNFDWTWQSNKIYFYYDKDISKIKNIECTQIERGMSIGSEYITIDGFDLRYFGSRCIGSPVYPEATRKGMQIRNCHLAYTSSKEDIGFGIALFHSDMIIEKNEIHNNGRRNISINITSGNNPVVMRDVIIQDNELYEGYHTTGIDMGITGSNHTIRNIIIRRNKIWEPYGLDKGDFASQFVFLYNHGDLEDCDSIFVYNNAFMNTNASGVFCHGIKNIHIVYNTFTGPATIENPGAFIYSGGTGNGNYTIMNNIFLNYNSRALTVVDGASDGSTTFEICDYNLYSAVNNGAYGAYIFYEIEGSNYRYTDWDAIRIQGYEGNSEHPQFPCLVDSITDLRLKKSSPAIDKAKPISYVTTDINGYLRDPKKPDLGAYEFGSTPSFIGDVQRMTVFPNPCKDLLTLKFNLDVENVSVQIVDSSGKVVYTNNFKSSQNEIEIEPKLSPGYYSISVKTDNSFYKSEGFVIIDS